MHIIDIGECFEGMKFEEVQKILYFFELDISKNNIKNDRQITLVGIKKLKESKPNLSLR